MGDSNEFDNWDPMAEDFYDANVNSYDTGAGANMPPNLQPALYKKNYDNTVKLYVYPLTPRMDEESLKNIFCKFGEVFDVHVDAKKQQWAFVYMKSQAAANKAISVMNENQEFQFKVTYAREKTRDSDSKSDTTTSRRSTGYENARTSNNYHDNLNSNVKRFFDSAPHSKSSSAPLSAHHETRSPLSVAFPSDLFPLKTTDNIEPRKSTLTEKSDSGLVQLPVCHHCSSCTALVCSKCDEPFCTINCSIRQYTKHRGRCIQVAPLTSPYTENSQDPTEYTFSTHRYATYSNEDPQTMLNNFRKTTTEYRETLASRRSNKILSSYENVMANSMNGDVKTERKERPMNYENDVNDFSNGSADWSPSFADDEVAYGRKESTKCEFDKNDYLRKSNKNRVAKNDNPPNHDTGSRRTHDSRNETRNVFGNNELSSTDNDTGHLKRDAGKRRSNFERPRQYTTMETNDEEDKEITTTRKVNEMSVGSICFSPPQNTVREKSRSRHKENVIPSDDAHRSISNRSRGANADLPISEDKFLSKRLSSKKKSLSPTRNNVAIIPDSMHSNSKIQTEKASPALEKRPYMMEDKRTKFRENVPIKVKVNEIEPTTVRVFEDVALFNDMMDDLAQEETNVLRSPKVGDRCLARKNKCWYRAIVKNVEPLQIRFVDVGGKVYPPEDELRELPDKYRNVRPFIHLVMFTNANAEELFALKEKTKPVDAFVEVLPIHVIEEKVISLELPLAVKNELAGELIKDENVSDTMNSVGSIPVDLTFKLEKDIPLTVIVNHIRDNVSFYVSQSDKISKLQEMMSKLDSAKLSAVDDIVLNRLYVAPFEGGLYRARIVQVEPLTVNFIDFGNSESVKRSDLKNLPTQFFHIPPMVILVKLQEGTIESNGIELYDSMTIIPVVEDMKDAIWIVRKASEPTPTLPADQTEVIHPTKKVEEAPSSAVLDIQVTYKLSHREYYVIEKKNMGTMEKIAELDDAQFSHKPVKTPKIGLLCITNFEGLWSRAKIQNLSPLKIFFIDFGNEETAQLEELYHLPEHLQKIPNLAFKIDYCGASELEENECYKIREKSDGTWELSDGAKHNPGSSRSSQKSVSSIAKPAHDMRVRVMVVTDENYGVILVEKIPLFLEVQDRLKVAAPTLKRIKNPQINDLCVTVDKCSTCYRVEIVDLDDKFVRVSYIDLGFEDKVNLRDLRSIPDDLLDIEPLAFTIAVENDEIQLQEHEEVDVEILAKVLVNYYFVRVHFDERNGGMLDTNGSGCESSIPKSETDESATSEAEEHVESNGSLTKADDCIKTNNKRAEETMLSTSGSEFMSRIPKMPEIANVTENLSSHSTGMLIILKKFSSATYSGMLMPPKSVQETMMMEISNLKFDPNYRPQTGEFVITYCSETKSNFRGFVVYEPTNLNPRYTVRSIDGGYFMNADKFARMPSKFKTVPSSAVVCDVKFFPNKKRNLKIKAYKYQIMSTYREKSLVEAELYKKGKVERYKVILKAWAPTIDEVGVQQIRINSEDHVKITSLNASNKCCITLTDEDTVDKRVEIMDEVMEHSLNAKLLNKPPLINDIVAVNFQETFYRGQILEEEENEKFLVRLLDRGDEISVQWKEMKSLPESLKLLYSTAVQVVMKDLKVTEMDSWTENYIQNLITNNKPFQIVIDHSSTVILKFLEDEDYDNNDCRTTLNEYLNFLLLPSWKREHFDLGKVPVFNVFCMKWEELEVGATMKLRLIEKFSTSSLCMINTRGKCFKKLTEINLRERLEDYAMTIKNSYVPKQNELCIVKFEDHWYRALCIQSIPGEKLEVELIDEGRRAHVWHTDIRQMLSDFLDYPALGIICNLIDYERYSENKIDKLIGTEVRDCKILNRVDNGEYDIEIRSLL